MTTKQVKEKRNKGMKKDENNNETAKKQKKNKNEEQLVEEKVENKIDDEMTQEDVKLKHGEEVDEVSELKRTIEDIQNRLLRSQADFDNYRKRTIAEKNELAKYASAKLIESLLPAIDNFERAISSSNDANNIESFIKGVEMVYRQIEDILTKEGLEAIETVGQAFNPELHQAVMQVETDEYESGVNVEELQKGYKFKGKIIRPSMVKVNA